MGLVKRKTLFEVFPVINIYYMIINRNQIIYTYYIYIIIYIIYIYIYNIYSYRSCKMRCFCDSKMNQFLSELFSTNTPKSAAYP